MEKSLIKNKTCALYLRISRDEVGEHRHSIETQKKILDKYCSDNEFYIYDYYIDRGFSGTTFKRPELVRMMTDVKYHQVDTVIVKDLSRLGRNHLAVGNLLEKEFINKIRFISVSEHIDTAYQYDDTIPLRNLINEYYSKDLSKKVKSGLKAKATKTRISSIRGGLYGYKYKENTFELMIDEEPAKIIQLIFSKHLEGFATNKIAKLISSQQAPTPGYLRYLYYKDKSGYQEGVRGTKFEWDSSMIRRILKTYDYTGNTIQYKTTTFHHKAILVPKELQLELKNSHPAIISIETYEKAQKFLKHTSHPKRNKEALEETFQGMIVNDSNHAMSFVIRNGKSEYRARKGNRYGIPAEDLKEIVLEELKDLTNVILTSEEAYTALLARKGLGSPLSKLSKIKKEETKLNSLGSILFMKKMKKGIDSDTYKSQMKEINEKLSNLKIEIEHLEESNTKSDNFKASFKLFKELLQKEAGKDIMKFARDVIEKIQVIKFEDKSYQIKIFYKFIGYI